MKSGIYAIGLMSCLISQPVLAASDYFDLAPEQLLQAEIISVSKKSERVLDAPAAVFVITGDDILRAGATTIPDALRLAPGVQVAQSDSNSWAISIRGFNGALANKLLVLIDGRTVYNPLYSGIYWEAQDVVLEDVDRIEVVRGPGGTLWGANAVNGVINIITKRAKDTQGGLVSGAYGNHERGLYNMRYGGSFGESGEDNYYRVYAKRFNRGPFPSSRYNGDNYDGSEGERTGFRADWSDKFTLQGEAYQTRSDQRDSIPVFGVPNTRQELASVTYQGAHILGRWADDMRDGKLTLQSYLDYSGRNESLILKDRRVTFDVEAQYNFNPIDIHDISIGGNYRYIEDDEGNTSTITFTPASRQDNLFSVFAQDKITLSPNRWYLTLGSKFEHNDYSGFEIQPNARLQYHPTQSQMLWGAVSRAVRTPSRLEHDARFRLLTGAGPSAFELVPNRNFDSEKMVAYEIGYREQIRPDLSLDVTGFYNDYDDLLTLLQLPNVAVNNGIDPPYTQIPLVANNGMTAEVYGLEIASKWNVNPDWSLSGSYSYLDMFLHAGTTLGAPESAEGLAPQNQINLMSSWKLTSDLSVDATIYYVDELSANNVGSYIRTDLNLGWRIADGVRFNLIGQNLFDDAHREFGSATGLNAAEAERSIYGKLTWQF